MRYVGLMGNVNGKMIAVILLSETILLMLKRFQMPCALVQIFYPLQKKIILRSNYYLTYDLTELQIVYKRIHDHESQRAIVYKMIH